MKSTKLHTIQMFKVILGKRKPFVTSFYCLFVFSFLLFFGYVRLPHNHRAITHKYINLIVDLILILLKPLYTFGMCCIKSSRMKNPRSTDHFDNNAMTPKKRFEPIIWLRIQYFTTHQIQTYISQTMRKKISDSSKKTRSIFCCSSIEMCLCVRHLRWSVRDR